MTTKLSISFIYRYVQHRITEQHEYVKQLIIADEGWFFVAGNSKNMPQAVREALIEAIGNEQYVEDMIKAGRYQEETWS